MKAKRRHALKKNTLAQELGELKRLISKHGGWIAGVILVVSVGLVITHQMRNRRTTQRQVEQQTYIGLRDGGGIEPEERLKGLIELSGSADSDFVAADCAVMAADLYSKEYLAEYPDLESEKALERRKNAETYYRQAMMRPGAPEALVAKAHLGLGVLAENAGETDLAKASYGKAAAMSCPAGDEAKQRLAMIDTWSEVGTFPTSRPTTRPTATTQPSEPTTQPATSTTQPAKAP